MTQAAKRSQPARPKPSYTVMIVPEQSSQVRRFKVPKARLQRLAMAAIAAVGLLLILAIHYSYMWQQAQNTPKLRAQNLELHTQMRALQREVQHIEHKLDGIQVFADKIRTLAHLSDPARNLALAPKGQQAARSNTTVHYAAGERIDEQDAQLDSPMAMRLLASSIDMASQKTQDQSQAMAQLEHTVQKQAEQLQNTPSIWPTPSRLLLSGFGMRQDPYTEQQVMHKGIDIAAEHNSPVHAPADGMVIFAGLRGEGYGKTMVIDHGLGLQTHYGHLEAFEAKVGQKVTRRQIIAHAGNSGRTRGPHLHYEVRFYGVPQDPMVFLLD